MTFKRYDPIVPIDIGLTQGLSSAFFTVVATRLGAVPLLVGIIASSPYVGNLLAPLWSFLTQRHEIKKVLAMAIFLASAVLVVVAVMRTPLLFTLAIVAYFVFFGAWDVLYPALLDSIYSQVAVGVLARFDQLRSIAYTLIVIFSGYVMGASGHRTTFIIAAVSLMLSGVVILQSKTEAASSDDLEKATVASIIREDSHIRRLVLIFMLAGTGMLMMLPALPVVEVKTLNLSDASIGILLAVNSLAYIIAMEIWPRVVRNVAALFVTFSVGLAAIAVMALLYGFFPTYALLIVANVFCGIGGSSISFFWQTFSISHPDYRTEDLSSLHLFTCGVRGVYAPLLGALIIALLGVKMNFVLSAGVVLIGLLLFLIKGKDVFPV